MPARQLNFDELQKQLVEWRREDKEGHRVGQTVLAVPSLSLPFFGNTSPQQIQRYEERIFYLAHILRNPLNRLCIVTSSPVPETLVSYLLHLLPGIPNSHARRRLTFFHLHDASHRPLTEKILSRPAFLVRLEKFLAGSPRSSISCYTVTELEQQLSERLQLPVHGPRPEHLRLTANSGSRAMFSGLGISHPVGASELVYIGDVARAMLKLARSKPALPKALLKHNYSISGMGNAVVDLRELQEKLQVSSAVSDEELVRWVVDRVESWTELVNQGDEWTDYWDRFQAHGGALEECVEGTPCSVQVRIDLDGSVQVIGTHEELLGGQEHQKYIGCKFPARDFLAFPMIEAGQKLGERMASEGVVGRFSVDFLAAPKNGETLDSLVAVDVHLRKGNTTLPLRTLQLLSGGRYDSQTGLFTDDRGRQLSYLSSDHFGGGQFKGMMARDLLEIVTSLGLHYSSASGTGAVFHMLSGLSELGQAGITCIERSPEEAERLYYQIFQALDECRAGYTWMT